MSSQHLLFVLGLFSRIVSLTSVFQPLLLHTGMGRLCTLDDSVSLATLIERIKRHLKLSHVRLALGVGRTLGKYVSFIRPACLPLTWAKVETLPCIVSERKPVSTSYRRCLTGLRYRSGWSRLCCGKHLVSFHKIYFSTVCASQIGQEVGGRCCKGRVLSHQLNLLA